MLSELPSRWDSNYLFVYMLRTSSSANGTAMRKAIWLRAGTCLSGVGACLCELRGFFQIRALSLRWVWNLKEWRCRASADGDVCTPIHIRACAEGTSAPLDPFTFIGYSPLSIPAKSSRHHPYPKVQWKCSGSAVGVLWITPKLCGNIAYAIRDTVPGVGIHHKLAFIPSWSSSQVGVHAP